MRNEFGLGVKNMAKRGQKTAKNSENGSQIDYAPVWNQSRPNILCICILRLTSYTGQGLGGKLRHFKEQGASS